MSENGKKQKLELLTVRISAHSIFKFSGLKNFKAFSSGFYVLNRAFFVQFSAFVWISDIQKHPKTEPLGIGPKVDSPKSEYVRIWDVDCFSIFFQASVRMELILLLQELQQENSQKQLLSPLPFPTTLPLLSACIAQQKTVVADPVRHLQSLTHDMLVTVVDR